MVGRGRMCLRLGHWFLKLFFFLSSSSSSSFFFFHAPVFDRSSPALRLPLPPIEAEVRADGNLIAHRAGHDQQPGFMAGETGDTLFECGRAAVFGVDVVAEDQGVGGRCGCG